jgi:hypothetical protein
MFTKTKIALAAALILSAGSAALASNENDGSVSGAQAAREMQQNPLPWWLNSSDHGRGAFAYQPGRPGARPLNSFERNWFDYQNHE